MGLPNDRNAIIDRLKTMYQYNAKTDSDSHLRRRGRLALGEEARANRSLGQICLDQCRFVDKPVYSDSGRARKIRESEECKKNCEYKRMKEEKKLTKEEKKISRTLSKGMGYPSVSVARDLRKYLSRGMGLRRTRSRKTKSRSRKSVGGRMRRKTASRARSRVKSRSRARSGGVMSGGRRKSRSRTRSRRVMSRSRSRARSGGVMSAGVLSGGRRRRRMASRRRRGGNAVDANPWLTYVAEVRDRMPGVPYGEVLQIASREWRKVGGPSMPRRGMRLSSRGYGAGTGKRARSRARSARSRRGASLLDNYYRYGGNYSRANYDPYQGGELLDNFYQYNV